MMSTDDSISVLMNSHTSDVRSPTCISLGESAAAKKYISMKNGAFV